MSVVLEHARALVGEAKHIGEFVRQQRQAKGWSQTDLAARSLLPQSEISQLERGHKYALNPSIAMLDRLASALAEDEDEKGRLLRAMLLRAGLRPSSLEAIVLGFLDAMNREETAAELAAV